MDLDFVCVHAGRTASELTRRDVARALLAVPSGVALVALPDLRRALMAAGNPLSLPFWDSAKTTLGAIESGGGHGGRRAALAGVHRHRADADDPSYFVWPEEDERGPIGEEMFARLVAYLEERVAAGEIDPDALAAG